MARLIDPRFPLYRPELERDACGVGFAADVRGRRSHEIVQRGLLALCRLTHRGAAPATASVDGAGLLTEIPWMLLERELPRRAVDRAKSRGVGVFFAAPDAEGEVSDLVTRELHRVGFASVHWRRVPVDPAAAAGADADPAEPLDRRFGKAPGIYQAIATAPWPIDGLDARLYAARVRIEAAGAQLPRAALSLVSLSSRTIVYKGLLTPDELPLFYPDLADPLFRSALVLFHQRFSTNTIAQWNLAQPFRLLAHNGEINTVAGNRLWMRARRHELAPQDAAAAVPVREAGSDSQSLDDAVEVMWQAGYSLPHAFSRLIPPAWERDSTVPPDVAAFHEYQSCFGEPWDGPAAIAFADGNVVGAMLDRNGFRPARYVRTADGLLALGSEAGIFDFEESEIEERGRLAPGQMIVADLRRGVIEQDLEVRSALAATRNYAGLVRQSITALPLLARPEDLQLVPRAELVQLQHLFGCTHEEVDVIIRPMAEDGHESVGSMGDDAPVAVLATRPRLLPDFFRQRFAQVTNPAMDPLRERVVMSLTALVGSRGDYLNEDSASHRLIALKSPVLSAAAFAALSCTDVPVTTVPIVFAAAGGPDALEAAMATFVDAACNAVAGGAAIVILSDRHADAAFAPVPPLLATAALHHALIQRGLRSHASIVVETGEARDAHQVATLLGYGAGAVCPYLGGQIAAAIAAGPPNEAVSRYEHALEEGLLKIFSKMGISTVSGYCGGQLFDVIGIGDDVIERFFAGTPASLGGLSLRDIAAAVLERHTLAFSGSAAQLTYPGIHGYRRDGEYHANNPVLVRQLHRSASTDGAEAYEAFTRLVYERPATALRDLLEFAPAAPLSVDEVEPREEITRRFFASAMSVGALSPEAHRAVAIAMNRLGGRSNSGEGGEEPDRFLRPAGETWSGSATKQIASARFGVTPAYIRSAEEIQIKIAQGSKPGEGGQLPAIKVVDHIAKLRHARPGITLISPPVHHDIYSIEDLAQLVYDLRALHPAARINVKLVAQAGVGIVAAGVAKAGADAIQISGHDGGTGASPRGSIKHAGSPWELGLAEANQVLTLQGLRHRVVLQADGGLKTGRDIAIAAALGADEFGFGTAALVALGCVMARQCHLNTCPVGIATQRPDLRARFAADPDQLVRYFQLLADEVRTILAVLGVRGLSDLTGRPDFLRSRAARPGVGARLDLSALLVPARASGATRIGARDAGSRERVVTPDDVDVSSWTRRDTITPIETTGTIRNTDRAVGARLAGKIAQRFGDAGVPAGSVRATLTGSAGQSFGAFCLPGISLHLIGEANDYLGKSMHGGEIVVSAPQGSRRSGEVLVGNTALYGATGGRVFIGGSAGERFAIRNSGGVAVVEGAGDHACEYMTGGTVVILGAVGRNFGAGMSGGVAYVLAPDASFARSAQMATCVPASAADRDELCGLLAEHARLTGSVVAAQLLLRGDAALRAFWKVAPLQEPAPLGAAAARPATTSASGARLRASASSPAPRAARAATADTPIPSRARAAVPRFARRTDSLPVPPGPLPGTG